MNNPMTKSTTIVFAVIGLLIIGIIVFLTYPKPTAAPTAETATTTAPVAAVPAKPSTGSVKPAATGTTGAAPSIGLSKVLLKDASGVSLYSGVDNFGRPVYNPVPNVDAATFKALTELTAVEHPTEKKGAALASLGAGSVAYYKDKNRVYVLSVFDTSASTEVAMQVVQDADVASFAPLSNPWYAKDKAHIYRLEAPTSEAPHTAGTYDWQFYDLAAITNVDLKSFVLVSGTGLTYDAHDKAHTYRKGIVAGTYPE